jgi:hypothetical protein
MTNFTKSDLMSFYQCPKRLWLEKNRPEVAHDEPDEMIIANGEAVGALAREQFPEGIHIETLNEQTALSLTQQYEDLTKPLFESAFEHGGVRVRVDILHGDTPTEVKSGTKLKEHYLTDAAIQAWATHHAGRGISKVQLAVVDSEFVYQGNGYDGLLKFEDITEQVLDSYQYIPGLIENAGNTVAGEEPLILTGPQCKKPHPCPFQDYCNATRPEYPIESLPRSAKIVDALRQKGIEAIEDIPENWLTNEIHQRVRRTVISGEAEIEQKLITFLQGLSYPRFYLDFEAIAFAVPIWSGTRPHQHLPFQWSCHIEPAAGELKHEEFLDISGNPPMRTFTESLIDVLGNTGPIVVYSPYEQRILKGLQELYPDLSDRLAGIIDRLVDILPMMRRHYYHPQQHGSWSIKALLPIVAPELNYKSLENVQNGTQAQLAFVKAISEDIDDATRRKLELDMLTYCKLDTLAMVKVVHFIQT